MNPEEMAARGREVEARQAQQSFQRDCFIIPQESVERFLPDGITVRTVFNLFGPFWAIFDCFWVHFEVLLWQCSLREKVGIFDPKAFI